MTEGEHGTTSEDYVHLIDRLNQQSVVKHFDAYADVPWQHPESRIDAEDPRFALPADDPLGGTAWYRGLAPARRARIGLHLVATKMRVGAQFENVLQRGLLEFALTLPADAPELRYVHHEVVEEGQHSLMFYEFVRRSGLEVAGLGLFERVASRRIVALARRFPALFFVFVLGGEEPIDHVQRRALSGEREIHPLLRRIMQIHVTEEARHLCFARRYLLETVPRLGAARRALLTVGAPVLLGPMARLMMQPPRQVIRAHDIPAAVIAEAYTDNPRCRQETLDALAKVRLLCRQAGVLTTRSAPLWKAAGVWAS